MSALAVWLAERMEERRLAVVGVGNRLRGDDGAGSLVAQGLGPRTASPVFDAETVPENYLGALLTSGANAVLFVDAADHGGAPGACCVARASELVPRSASTHAPSLRLLAGLLEGRGIECWLLAIQPRSTALGGGLSPPVDRAVREAVATIASALERRAPHA